MAKWTCLYCGKEDFRVSDKKMIPWMKKRRLEVKSPVCGRCWTLIKLNRIPVGITASEMNLVEEIKKCVRISHGLSKMTPINEIQELVDVIDKLSVIYTDSSAEFEVAASRTAQLAKKTEWLRHVIDESKDKIEEKLSVSYHWCRKMASKAISNRGVRDAVFKRDNHSCKICGSKDNLSIDHIRPVRMGGGDEFENYQTLCLSCNCRKGARYTLSEMSASSI